MGELPVFKFREKFSSQGITWEQLGFQFVVILLGVYLAIFFEGCAEDRQHGQEAADLMVHVLDELLLDERDFQAVSDGREEVLMALDSLTLLFRIGSDSNGPQVDSLLRGPLAVVQTAFPRRAAYSALVSGGYLTAIRDQALSVRLANLYEHHYSRVGYNGEMIDGWFRETYFLSAEYWDADRMVFVAPGANAGPPARTALGKLRILYDWYAGTLLEDVLAELTEVRKSVEEYLGLVRTGSSGVEFH